MTEKTGAISQQEAAAIAAARNEGPGSEAGSRQAAGNLSYLTGEARQVGGGEVTGASLNQAVQNLTPQVEVTATGVAVGAQNVGGASAAGEAKKG